HDGKDGHRFREPVYGTAPGLIHQQQEGGDQRAGMTDSDPPDEIRDGESPRDWNFNAPNADSFREQIGDRDSEHDKKEQAEPERTPPEQRHLAGEHNRTDLFAHRLERRARRYYFQRIVRIQPPARVALPFLQRN